MENKESFSKDIGIDCPIGKGTKRFNCQEECIEDRMLYIYFCENENCINGRIHCEFMLCSAIEA